MKFHSLALAASCSVVGCSSAEVTPQDIGQLASPLMGAPEDPRHHFAVDGEWTGEDTVDRGDLLRRIAQHIPFVCVLDEAGSPVGIDCNPPSLESRGKRSEP